MKKRTDSVTVQSWEQTTQNGTKLPLRNILARFNPTATARVLYVTHWDTRPTADDDPNFGNRARPILGANDGAAGVSGCSSLPSPTSSRPPRRPSVSTSSSWTARIGGRSRPTRAARSGRTRSSGRQYFANHPPSPTYQPLYGVLFDMIGDADLQLWQEETSIRQAPEVVTRVWNVAKELGYGSVPPRPADVRHHPDDHLPLLNKGWHVMDLIDMQYGSLPANAGPNDPANPRTTITPCRTPSTSFRRRACRSSATSRSPW